MIFCHKFFYIIFLYEILDVYTINKTRVYAKEQYFTIRIILILIKTAYKM